MPSVDVNGARLWYDEAGQRAGRSPPARRARRSGLWEPVVPLLAERFRTIRTDLRFYGRSTGPAAPWSWEDDAIGVLDALGVERAAVVGLSLGGRLALDVALAHPERLWAVAGVAPGLAVTTATRTREEQDARYEAAEPPTISRRRWRSTSRSGRRSARTNGSGSSGMRRPRRTPTGRLEPTHPRRAREERLGELAVPTLDRHGRARPGGMREIGPLVARGAPNARHVELDSDHYVTLREPELLSRVLVEFLSAAAPQE